MYFPFLLGSQEVKPLLTINPKGLLLAEREYRVLP